MTYDAIAQSEEPDVFRHFIVWSLRGGAPITVAYAFISSVLSAMWSGTGDFRVGIYLAMVAIAIPLLVGVGLLHAYILNKILAQHYHFPIFNNVSTVPFSFEALRYYRWRVPIILFPISYIIVIALLGIFLLFPAELTSAFFGVGSNLVIPMSIVFVVAAIRYLSKLHRHDLEVYPEYKEKKKKRTELS